MRKWERDREIPLSEITERLHSVMKPNHQDHDDEEKERTKLYEIFK